MLLQYAECPIFSPESFRAKSLHRGEIQRGVQAGVVLRSPSFAKRDREELKKRIDPNFCENLLSDA